MPKPDHIPLHTLDGKLVPGLFVKRITASSHHETMHHAHRDDFYLFVLMTRGCAILAVDFEEHSLRAGEALVVSPSQVHFPVSSSPDAELWVLALAPEYLLPRETEIMAQYSLHVSPISLAGETDAADISALFGILFGRQHQSAVAIPLASSIKALMLCSITRGHGQRTSRYMSVTLRFKDLLEAHLSKTKSPSGYASMMAISEVYLNEAVKAVTGMSVSDFILYQVVIHAKRSLLFTALPVQDIALSLGYEDCAYFSRLFKKKTGLSPAHYRKNLG